MEPLPEKIIFRDSAFKDGGLKDWILKKPEFSFGEESTGTGKDAHIVEFI